MVRNGQMTGYMSIRTRATEDEVAAVEPLYKALNEGRSKNAFIKGWWYAKAGSANYRRCRCAGECVA